MKPIKIKFYTEEAALSFIQEESSRQPQLKFHHPAATLVRGTTVWEVLVLDRGNDRQSDQG